MPKEEYISITLPKPPSLNWLFAGKAKRFKSKEYKQWLALAELEMRKQAKYTLTGNEWLRIDLNYFMPLYYKNWKHKKEDLDNLFKALLDFLWDNIEWFEDSNIKIINAEKHDSELNIVKILIKEYEKSN
jgi:Holliday junction resolvase RusA-like endonuclease